MTVGCLRSAGTWGGYSRYLCFVLVVLGYLSKCGHGQGTPACVVTIPTDEYTITASSNTTPPEPGVWCPSGSDTNPSINYTLVPSAVDNWSLFQVTFGTVADPNFDEYAATYNMSIERDGVSYVLETNTIALQRPRTGSFVRWSAYYIPPILFSTVEIFPLEPLNVSGLCMVITVQGCPVSDMCPDVNCSSNGKCVGWNQCLCNPKFYGRTCSYTGFEYLQSVKHLSWDYVNATELETQVGDFTCPFSGGFTLQGTRPNGKRLILSGSGAYLSTTILSGDFECLMTPSLTEAFYISFTYSIKNYTNNITGLFGTSYLDGTDGVNAYIITTQSDRRFLHVDLRRERHIWSVSAQPDAVQNVNVWTRLEISWDTVSGLVVFVDNTVVARLLLPSNVQSRPASSFTIGYPSSTFSPDYDVQLTVREFTVTTTTRAQFLLAQNDYCEIPCENSGICIGFNTCDCVSGYYGPGCIYTDGGYALTTYEIVAGTINSSMGVLDIKGSGTVLLSFYHRGFILKEAAYVTTIVNEPWSILISNSLVVDPITVFLRFTIFDIQAPVTCVLCTSNFSSGNQLSPGVNVIVDSSFLMTVQINSDQEQWHISYLFNITESVGKDVAVEFTMSNRTMELFVYGVKVETITQPSFTNFLSASADSITFGSPSSSQISGENLSVTINNFRIWEYARADIIYVEGWGEQVDSRNSVTVPPTSPTVAPTVAPSTSTPSAPTGSDCFLEHFTELEIHIVNSTLELLRTMPRSRMSTCLSLRPMITSLGSKLDECWLTAENRDDSTSSEAFIHYVFADPINDFSSMATLLCMDNIPEETNDECKLEDIGNEVKRFFDLADDYEMGRQRCSVLWSSYDRLSVKMMSCSDNTRTVLRALLEQISRMSSIACESSTCNLAYATLSIKAALRSVSAYNRGNLTAERVCWDLKVGLASTVNHTRDCNGATYNMVFERVQNLRHHYRDNCNATLEKPPCDGRISNEHLQEVLTLSAYGKLFPKDVLCSFQQKDRGSSGEISPNASSPPVSLLLQDYCALGNDSGSDAGSECACGPNIVSRMGTLQINISLALVNSDTSVCDSIENGILTAFEDMKACQYFYKIDRRRQVEQSFRQLCGRELDTDLMICPTYCNLTICEFVSCTSMTECLAQNTAGCNDQDALQAALDMQIKCLRENTDTNITLRTRPHLNGLLECMVPLEYSLVVKGSIPIGKFCNELGELRDCFEVLKEDAPDDELKELLSKASNSILKRVNSTVCEFLPKEDCKSGYKADVVFLLDTSGSIGSRDFSLLIQFVEDVLSGWNVGKDEIRVGVLKFSTNVHIQFQLDTYNTKAEVLDAVKNVMYIGGTTHTDKAIDAMTETMFTRPNGNRMGVSDFGIIITDGKSANETLTLQAAEAARALNITMMSVGIGNNLDLNELKAMASLPTDNHVMTVSNFSSLADFKSEFVRITCTVISDFILPYTPSGDGAQCSAYHDVLAEVESTFLNVMKAPYFFTSFDARATFCTDLPGDIDEKNLTECGDNERKYLVGLFDSMSDIYRGVCGMADVEEGCNLPAAADCVGSLANAFIMPGVTPCSQYSKAEACVVDHTVHCKNGADWYLKYVMEEWKDLAESTCCKGPCDPAEAVLCFVDVHNMAKSPSPDWGGICSELEGSQECANSHVEGCDRCQKDTIKVIGSGFVGQLKETCQRPPENYCRATYALECKQILTRHRNDFARADYGFLCLKVFEARICVEERTESCDKITTLTVNIDLENLISELGGTNCSKDSILPVCYQTMMGRVTTILSFDPLNRQNPAFIYTPGAQNTTDDNDFAGFNLTSPSSMNLINFPPTYMGRLCSEAQLAYLCVVESMRDYPQLSERGFMDVLNTTWQLALFTCADIVVPLTCYTCHEADSNAICNYDLPEDCGEITRMCQTSVQNNAFGDVVSISKSCVVPFDCEPGCENGTCTYCCDSPDCNKPDNGPLRGSCDLLEISGCLYKISSGYLDSQENCSFVNESLACLEYSRERCEVNGVVSVAQALTGFLLSRSVVLCRVQETDNECGLFAVTALATMFASGGPPDDFDFCPMVSLVQMLLAKAALEAECANSTLEDMLLSFHLIRSQLSNLDCGSTTPPQPVCDPLEAIKLCLVTSSADCDLDEKIDCIQNMTVGCQSVQLICPYIALHTSADFYCSNNSVTVPNVTDDIRPLRSCFEMFAVNFNAGSTDGTAMGSVVNELLACLLSNWDVGTILILPPVYKLYVEETFSFLDDVLLPAVTHQLGDLPVVVGANTPCESALTEMSYLFTSEIMIMLFRPFMSRSDNFCLITRNLEMRIDVLMISCTTNEVKYQTRLMSSLRYHRVSLCPVDRPPPQCSVEMASQLIIQFTAFMEVARDEDVICINLNITVDLVRLYTTTCNVNQTEEVNADMITIFNLYWSMCTEVVSESMCGPELIQVGTPNCILTNPGLDSCSSESPFITCGGVQQLAACYREKVGTCNNDEVYRIHFKTNFPDQFRVGKRFCGLNLETWTLANQWCIAPICDVTTAATCLSTDDLIQPAILDSTAQGLVANASTCLEDNLAGCDVVVRAHVIYNTHRQLIRIINAGQNLAAFNLSLNVTFTDPFGEWVPEILIFFKALDNAYYNPEWDLIPLCWVLFDFNTFLKNSIENDPFKAALFQRATFGFGYYLDKVCNDRGLVDGTLNLPPAGDEHDHCPADEFIDNARVSFLEAVLTGILQKKSREHLCENLVLVKSIDISRCSVGRRQQIRFMIYIFEGLVGGACDGPRFCSVRDVRRCATRVLTTIQGLGVSTYTREVCSSITVLETCVRRFSFRCNGRSMRRIGRITRRTRRMARRICRRSEDDDPTPTCDESVENSVCDKRRLWKCGFRQLRHVLSSGRNREIKCRMLQSTQNCYDAVTEACTRGGISMASWPRVANRGLANLTNKWNCADIAVQNDTLDDDGQVVCTNGCDVAGAVQCISNMTSTLRFWNRFRGSACLEVTEARQCLVQKAGRCEGWLMSRLRANLESQLEFFPSLVAHCVDVYSCLNHFFSVSRHIFARESASTPDPDGQGSSGQTGSLAFLCGVALEKWECAEHGLHRLSRQQRRLLRFIGRPLRRLVADRCANTVALRCNSCSNTTFAQAPQQCDGNTETCGHNQRCFSEYEGGRSPILVTRGCTRFGRCRASDTAERQIRCCDTNNCNDNDDIRTQPAGNTTCFVEFAFDCAFTFVTDLINRGSVVCRTAMLNLQCVAKYSERCPAFQSLFTAVNSMMLSLAQTTCVQGDLSGGCSSIAVSSMEAILSNAYSSDSACSGLKASEASVDLQERHGNCSALDLVALRQALSYASVITQSLCNKGDCEDKATVATPVLEPEEDKCQPFQISLCAHRLLKEVNNLDNQNLAEKCRQIREDMACTKTTCRLCRCLQRLIDHVNSRISQECPAVPPTTPSPVVDCMPSSVCDVVGATRCVDTLASAPLNESTMCTGLIKAGKCRSDNVAGCRSIQSAISVEYFRSNLGDIMTACEDSVTVDLTIPIDVFSSTAICAVNLLRNIKNAMNFSSFVGPMCNASAEFNACPKNLPSLVQSFVLNSTMEMLERWAPDSICSNYTGDAGAGGDRRKREASCGGLDLSRAVNSLSGFLFMSSTPLGNRNDFCAQASSARSDITAILSAPCAPVVGFNEAETNMLTNMKEESVFDQYCVPTLFTPAGCNLNMFQDCMVAFTRVSSFCKSAPEALCRAAGASLECINKFSINCTGDFLAQAVWQQVRATVGNTCTDLTLGLFCSATYPSLTNSYPCNLTRSMECLPEKADLGPLRKLSDPNYCDNLEDDLECALNGVEGCLKSQVQEATTAVANLSTLPVELQSCGLDIGLANYSSVCIAEKTCSLTAALECFKLAVNDNSTDCTVLSGVEVCLHGNLESCADSTEAVSILHGLFQARYQATTLENCTSPFEGKLDSFSGTYNCTEVFIGVFRAALTSQLKMDAVCASLEAYKTCILGVVADAPNLPWALKSGVDYTADIDGASCKASGGVDASGSQVSSSCDLNAAVFCLTQEITWVLNRNIWSRADNNEFCDAWHHQDTHACVVVATSQCDPVIQTFFEKVVELSNRLVVSSKLCGAVSTCVSRESYININQFSVSIALYASDGNVPKLCLKKKETEANVARYTDTCTAFRQGLVAGALARVTSLIGGLCIDAVLPPPPICPALPRDQRECNVGAAFLCVTHFNTEILYQGQSLIWRDWCMAMENAMRCAAFNTSSCAATNNNLQYVVQGLDKMKGAVGYRCPWLNPDLCSRNPPCPAQRAGCDISLKINLLNDTMANPCTYINEAKACMKQHTLTCTESQKVVAGRVIQRRLQGLSIPNLKCDGAEVTPCLLQARAASWHVFTVGGNGSFACDIFAYARKCFADRVGVLPIGSYTQQLTTLVGNLENIITGWCAITNVSATCGDPLARVVHSLYDMAISLVTSTMDQSAACSARQAMMAEIQTTRDLYIVHCTFLELDSVEAQLKTDFANQCVSDKVVDCQLASAAAEQCINETAASSQSCSDLSQLVICVAPVVGLCEQIVYQPYIDQVKAFIDNSTAGCNRPPIIGLSTPTSSPIYLSELGGSAGLKFRFAETYQVYAGNERRQVRIRAQISNENPPRCLGNPSQQISQMSVVYKDDKCGVKLINDSSWDTPHTMYLVANQDGRNDGTQNATVTLFVDTYYKEINSSTWVRDNHTFLLAEYKVNIEDSGVNAECSSVGPHIQSFDSTSFSTRGTGIHLLYRNTFVATAVSVTFQQCVRSGTCSCAVNVFAGDTQVRFDRCRVVGALVPPEAIKVTMETYGKDTDLAVYKQEGLQKYFVVLPTGTIVIIKANNKYLDVWITASTYDIGKTEGLCGFYDNDAFNDLMLPDGKRYIVKELDVEYGMLGPQSFVEAWKLLANSGSYALSSEASRTIASRTLAPSCSCLDSYPANDQCSPLSKVDTCDFVQGSAITKQLELAAPILRARKRRSADDNIDLTTNFPTEDGWPTASNWTEEMAKEHCETLLIRNNTLHYCDQAVLAANGTYSYDNVINTCMDDIRLSDSISNADFTTSQAEEKCRLLFLHNTTYQNSNNVRLSVLRFLDQTCPDNCNNNGDCTLGVCHCYPGFVGGNCSFTRTALPHPFDTKIIQNGLCEVTATKQCDNIFFTGEGMIDSSYLSCHIQPVKVLPSGAVTLVGLPSDVPATLMTAEMAYCQFSRSNSAQQTLQVAASNDGINTASVMLFTAYDPHCYACNPQTHLCTNIATSACEINGQCVMPEAMSANNSCYFCDPRQATRKWSVKDSPECDGFRQASSGDDDSSETSYLLIAILGVLAALLVLGTIVAIVFIVKKRKERNPGRDNPPAYGFDNAGYFEPQEFFNQHAMHKRAHTRDGSFLPSARSPSPYK